MIRFFLNPGPFPPPPHGAFFSTYPRLRQSQLCSSRVPMVAFLVSFAFHGLKKLPSLRCGSYVNRRLFIYPSLLVAGNGASGSSALVARWVFRVFSQREDPFRVLGSSLSSALGSPSGHIARLPLVWRGAGRKTSFSIARRRSTSRILSSFMYTAPPSPMSQGFGTYQIHPFRSRV